MNTFTRFHPARMLTELYSLIKNSLVVAFFLFIVKGESTSFWFVWGRYIFIIAIILTLITIVINWRTEKYAIEHDRILLKEGLFIKKDRIIQPGRVHNHHTSTTFIHRWFNLTSLTLETGTSGEDAAIKFPVLTETEKERILNVITQEQPEDKQEVQTEDAQPQRTIYFRSTKKDLIKASMLSFSFLAIFPLLLAGYTNINDFYNLDRPAGEAFNYALQHWWIIPILLIVSLALSTGIGYIQTTIKYGEFEIAADNERIYLKKGVGNTTTFSIQKHRVQAIQLEQTLTKRLLGLVSIKLLTAGGSSGETDTKNELYPFMPKKQAYQLVQQLLPDYTIQEHMQRLPKKALYVHLASPYWITLITTAALITWARNWWWLGLIMLTLAILNRTLDYLFTSYTINNQLVQIRTGGIITQTFITHKPRIQQLDVTRNWLEQKTGLAKLNITNRINAQHHTSIYGLTTEDAAQIYKWYQKKTHS